MTNAEKMVTANIVAEMHKLEIAISKMTNPNDFPKRLKLTRKLQKLMQKL